MRHRERHKSQHIGWLRAAVLGANDGIVSTASLMIGVAAAHANQSAIVLAGVAGLVAGAMSMAAGEYVSVSSQADTEAADLARERKELETDHVGEHKELTDIYVARGLDRSLAHDVSTQLMEHDALAAHARDELGIYDFNSARPLQAAFASAIAFSIGAALPLFVIFLSPFEYLIPALAIMSLVFLAVLGGVSARAGGANIYRGIIRVTFWGALAMLLTAVVGRVFGVML